MTYLQVRPYYPYIPAGTPAPSLLSLCPCYRAACMAMRGVDLITPCHPCRCGEFERAACLGKGSLVVAECALIFVMCCRCGRFDGAACARQRAVRARWSVVLALQIGLAYMQYLNSRCGLLSIRLIQVPYHQRSLFHPLRMLVDNRSLVLGLYDPGTFDAGSPNKNRLESRFSDQDL